MRRKEETKGQPREIGVEREKVCTEVFSAMSLQLRRTRRLRRKEEAKREMREMRVLDEKGERT